MAAVGVMSAEPKLDPAMVRTASPLVGWFGLTKCVMIGPSKVKMPTEVATTKLTVNAEETVLPAPTVDVQRMLVDDLHDVNVHAELPSNTLGDVLLIPKLTPNNVNGADPAVGEFLAAIELMTGLS